MNKVTCLAGVCFLYFLCGVGSPSALALEEKFIRGELPPCGGVSFSISPIEMRFILEIQPLGALAPPQHTLPASYLYFHTTKSFGETFWVRAPGDVYLLKVSGPVNLNEEGD